MLIAFIFSMLVVVAFLWALDVALDSYKEYGKQQNETRLKLYREGIVSDWRVKRRDINC